MAFKMKNGSMAKMAKEAGNNRVSPMRKDDKPGYKEEEDKALLDKVQKEKIATDSGNKEKVAELKKAYNRTTIREVDGMSRKEARQEVRADRKEARAERKEYRKKIKRNQGGAFAGEGRNPNAGKNVPGAFSSKKKKKSYLAAKRLKGFDSYLSDVAKVEKRESGSSKP